MEMILVLNTLIELCLIVAVFLLSKRKRNEIHRHEHRVDASKHIKGIAESSLIQSKIAEKFAERAFNLASSANLGVVALQKSLAQPRLLTKTQLNQNAVAKNDIDKLFTTQGGMDWLRPILSDEELEILDEAERAKERHNSNHIQGKNEQ
jgi:hypothetical protein